MKKLLPIIKLCLCVAVIAVAPSARAETCIGDAVSCTRDPATGKTTCITVVGPPCRHRLFDRNRARTSRVRFLEAPLASMSRR